MSNTSHLLCKNCKTSHVTFLPVVSLQHATFKTFHWAEAHHTMKHITVWRIKQARDWMQLIKSKQRCKSISTDCISTQLTAEDGTADLRMTGPHWTMIQIGTRKSVCITCEVLSCDIRTLSIHGNWKSVCVTGGLPHGVTWHTYIDLPRSKCAAVESISLRQAQAACIACCVLG